MGSTEFVKGPFGARVRSGRLIQAAALILAGCLWISANLGELVYAARDISLAVLVVGVAALAAAVGLVLWLYDKVHTDPKSCASSAAAWAARWCWLSAAGCLPFPTWAAGWNLTSC